MSKQLLYIFLTALLALPFNVQGGTGMGMPMESVEDNEAKDAPHTAHLDGADGGMAMHHGDGQAPAEQGSGLAHGHGEHDCQSLCFSCASHCMSLVKQAQEPYLIGQGDSLLPPAENYPSQPRSAPLRPPRQ